MRSLLRCLTTILLLSPVTTWAGVEVQIIEQGDTVHFEVGGKTKWDYELKKMDTEKKFFVELRVPKLSDSGLQKLTSFKSKLITAVAVDSKGPDGQSIVRFQLANDSIESFDYLTDQPSRLIVDFFINQDKAAAKPSTKSSPKTVLPIANSEAASAKAVAAPADNTLQSKERKPANDTLALNINEPANANLVNRPEESKADAKTETLNRAGVFDGADPGFERFQIKDYELKEESVIAAKENTYLEFPILHLELPYLESIKTNSPVYEVIPADTDENKQARLLLTLFQKKRYNVFLKTLNWFLEKYPQSQYDEIVRFMWADAYFDQWLEARNANDFDLAILRYRLALQKYPQSILAERTQMLMGFASLDRGDYFGTLRQFQKHLRVRPSSPNRDIARLGIADAYLKINRWDEAIEQYNEIEKEHSDSKYVKMAAYFRGDVHFKKQDFAKAIVDYQAAIKKYPDTASEFPNAFFNQAAANFNLGNFKQSLNDFNDYLKKFPADAYAGYAMTRVGELLEILGADKKKVNGAFLETYFRYGDTPSSVVARLRLLSGRMAAMKPKEVEKAVKDIEELAKNSELAKIDQFATLMIAEGFQKRKEYDKATGLLIKYYQAHPTGSDLKMVSTRIVKYINDYLRDLVSQGNYMDALKVHNRYADNWLKNTNRIDTKFNVARSFELAGVLNESETLYRDTINRIYALKGTKEEKERSVIEKLPALDELNLRLSAVTFNLGKFSQSFDYLKAIKNPEKLSDIHQIDRVQLAASLLEKKGDFESATRYLVELLKEWKGIPELVADPYLSLAQLEIKMGKRTDAVESLQKIEKLMQESGKVSAITHSKALELEGNLYFEDGKMKEASAAYERLLAKYEDVRPLDSIRYRLGEIHFKKGENQKATEIWEPLKNRKNTFWHKLAKEQLQSSQFGGEYKKYIKRIPAMAGKE